MRIERKKSRYDDAFWVLKLKNVNEQKELIQDIQSTIGNLIREESRTDFNIITDILKRASHDDKYDEEGELSVIIHSSQIANLLIHLFLLCGLVESSTVTISEHYNTINQLVDVKETE